jgi:hypothetical protein
MHIPRMKRTSSVVTAGLRRPVVTIALAGGVAVALAAGASASARAGVGSPGTAGAVSRPSAAAGVLAGTWKRLPAAPVTWAPQFLASVWTGHELIVRGIQLELVTRRFTIGYRLAANAWAQLARGPVPGGIEIAAWTGSEMLALGANGGAYKPATNRWRPIAADPFPQGGAVAGWTGRSEIVWGGIGISGPDTRNGAAYNPATNTWRKLPPAPLERRRDAMGAWTGRVLVVAGGFTFNGGQRFFRDAAAYNPASNTWRKLPAMPQARASGTAVWDGREVLFLGGSRPGANGPAGRGMAYNPATNRWRLLPAMQFARFGFAVVWTGRHVLVWGGVTGAGIPPPHGEAYNPGTNSWTALPPAPLRGRPGPTVVWTGHSMIVWGGGQFTDGAIFTPRKP